MLRYPIKIAKDGDGYTVRFPDFPEAHTFGEDRDEAKVRAVDALATVIDAYMEDRRPIPTPSAVRRDSAALPPLMALSVELYRAMQEQKVNKAELGRRLQWHMPQVDRALDIHHTSRLEQLQMALEAVGRQVDVTVVKVA